MFSEGTDEWDVALNSQDSLTPKEFRELSRCIAMSPQGDREKSDQWWDNHSQTTVATTQPATSTLQGPRDLGVGEQREVLTFIKC